MAARSTSKTSESSDKVSVICRALRRAIIEQALEPGAKLPEDSLGERFGVSRTIARHALGQLAAEGLVELRRNRIAVWRRRAGRRRAMPSTFVSSSKVSSSASSQAS
jgi:DNA-binding GntR family transcriptional regulator